jgi:hypothetical protein
MVYIETLHRQRAEALSDFGRSQMSIVVEKKLILKIVEIVFSKRLSAAKASVRCWMVTALCSFA